MDFRVIAWPSWTELEAWFRGAHHRAHGGVGVPPVEVSVAAGTETTAKVRDDATETEGRPAQEDSTQAPGRGARR
jgi:hypothetical protein